MVISLLVIAIRVTEDMLGTSRYLTKSRISTPPTTKHRKNHNNNNNGKKKRAISPVIATVILVAVAVVIAAAMAGFAGSLFGTYSQNSQIKIRDATFSAGAKTITINFVNSGSTPDSLVSVSLPTAAGTLTATGAALTPSATLLPNTTTQVVATFTGTMPSVGQQVTFTATTNSGQSYTFSVVVSA